MPHLPGAEPAHRRAMNAEKVVLTFVGLVLAAFFVAVLILPHHAPGCGYCRWQVRCAPGLLRKSVESARGQLARMSERRSPNSCQVSDSGGNTSGIVDAVEIVLRSAASAPSARPSSRIDVKFASNFAIRSE